MKNPTAEIAKAIALLVNTYPTPGWSVEAVDAYQALLADLDSRALQAAVVAWIKTRPERPTVADLRAAVRQQLEAAGAIPQDLEPGEAWGYVTQQFVRVGRYRSFPTQPHALVAEAVNRLGWETLCASDNPEASRPHFWRVYGALLEQDRQHRHAAPGLMLPNDAARLAGPTETHPAAAAITNGRKTGQVRLAGAAQPMQLGHIASAVLEPLREPTPSELEAARQRKTVLKRQLVDVESAASEAERSAPKMVTPW